MIVNFTCIQIQIYFSLKKDFNLDFNMDFNLDFNLDFKMDFNLDYNLDFYNFFIIIMFKIRIDFISSLTNFNITYFNLIYYFPFIFNPFISYKDLHCLINFIILGYYYYKDFG